MEHYFLYPDFAALVLDAIKAQAFVDYLAMLAAFLSFWAVYGFLSWVWEALEARAVRRRIARRFADMPDFKKEVGNDDDCAF